PRPGAARRPARRQRRPGERRARRQHVAEPAEEVGRGLLAGPGAGVAQPAPVLAVGVGAELVEGPAAGGAGFEVLGQGGRVGRGQALVEELLQPFGWGAGLHGWGPGALLAALQ